MAAPDNTATEPAPPPDAVLRYSIRPKPLSGELIIRLSDIDIVGERARSRQRILLSEIAAINLRFSPRNAVRLAFTCVLHARDGRKLAFDNVSWKSLFEAERLDAGYITIVRALLARIHAVNPALKCHAGVSRLRYIIMMATGIATVLMLAGVSIYSLARQNTTVGLLSLAMTAYLAFWLKEFLTRNHPRDFTPEAIPSRVLPAEIPPTDPSR